MVMKQLFNFSKECKLQICGNKLLRKMFEPQKDEEDNLGCYIMRKWFILAT
jgi:hypothetical protein